MKRKDLPDGSSKINKAGILIAAAFYVLSVVMVIINTFRDGDILDSDVETITIAHWQLEDGYREGINKAIKLYEQLKRKQGKKVRVIQSTVPARGYIQWLITQLISGDPADIVELRISSQLQNQYFVPLSSYLYRANPYNKNTLLEGIPWKDTFINSLNSSLDPVYAEYYGVATCFHVQRIYVNKDLLKKATGSDRMPRTFEEWMADCKKLREYGEKTGKPIIPIGVRGFDKLTLGYIFRYYFAMLNGNLNDTCPTFCSFASSLDILSLIAKGEADRNRLLGAVDLVQELGRNFCKGFTATDAEQTKFLFCAGNVGFFPEGSWSALSLVNNSPFEVEVINLPMIGPDNRYYKFYTRPLSDAGFLTGKFGITKASRHFNLALDFLQFLTSYKINQMTMEEYSKWPPAVINAEYGGLLKKFKPIEGDAMRLAPVPFWLTQQSKSQTKILETLELIIINNIPNPKEYFWKRFISCLPLLIEEIKENQRSNERQFFNLEGYRSCIGAGLMGTNIQPDKRKSMNMRYSMGLENLVVRMQGQYNSIVGMKELEKLQTENQRPNNNGDAPQKEK